MKSLDDILNLEVAKKAVAVGFGVGIVWLVIGYIFWDSIFALASYFLSWIPFAILKANAAFLIGAFAWFLLVLSTYSILMVILNLASFNRKKSKSYEVISLVLMIIVSIFWTLFGFFNWDFVYKKLEQILMIFPFKTLEETIAALLTILVFYNLFIFSLYLIDLILGRKILKDLALKEFGCKSLNIKSNKKLLLILLKDFLIFLVALVISFPLFFIPFINIATQVFLWAWLIKRAYYLSSSTICLTEEESKILLNKGAMKWIISIITSFLNLIPIINLFAPFFAQNTLFYWSMSKALPHQK
jgi:hypothetical protein